MKPLFYVKYSIGDFVFLKLLYKLLRNIKNIFKQFIYLNGYLSNNIY